MFVDPKRKPGVAYKPVGPPVAQAKMAGQVAPSHGHGVVQLTLCWLWVNGRQKTNGKGPQGSFEAKNGTKPAFHAERQAWNKNAANAREAKEVKFQVDTPVCVDCQNWFKTTVLPAMRGKPVTIEVKGISVQLGDGMDWTGVGDREPERVVIHDALARYKRDKAAGRRR